MQNPPSWWQPLGSLAARENTAFDFYDLFL